MADDSTAPSDAKLTHREPTDEELGILAALRGEGRLVLVPIFYRREARYAVALIDTLGKNAMVLAICLHPNLDVGLVVGTDGAVATTIDSRNKSERDLN